MGQPVMSGRRGVCLSGGGSTTNASSSRIVVESKVRQFCSASQIDGIALQTVEEPKTGAALILRERPQLRTGKPRHAGHGKQRKLHCIEGSASATERRSRHVARRLQAAHGLNHIRTAVRNHKRRWRLLAHHELLADVFKAASPRRAPLNGQRNLPHGRTRACVLGVVDELRCLSPSPKTSVERRSGGSSRLGRFRAPCEAASSAAPVSSPVEGTTGLPSPPRSRSCPLHEFSTSPVLQSAAARSRRTASAATDGTADMASRASPPRRSPAAAAVGGDTSQAGALRADPSAAESAEAAATASLIMNPPSFADLGVCPALVRVAASLHIERPSPIQVLTLPRALRGGDLCGVAPTGTGKTLCYCWPLLQRIARGNGHAFLGVVLLPARELAVQVLEQFRIYGDSLGTRVCVLLGGRDLTEEGKTLLHQAPHVIIATPGRLADNVQNNLMTMRQRLSVVEVLVLDEADMLLSDEFKEDLKCILACLPPSSAAVCSSSRNLEITPGEHASAAEGTPANAAQKPLQSVTAHEEAASKKGEEAGQQNSYAGGRSASPAFHAGGTRRVATGTVPHLRRQTLLFSATISPALLALQQQRFGDVLMPLFNATAAAAVAAAVRHPRTEAGHGETPEAALQQGSTQQQQLLLLPRLSHYYLFVPTAMRLTYLLYLLEHVPPYNRDRGIIFAGSVRQTQRLCTALEVLKQQVTSLHSIMKQRARIACLEKFRSEVARLLVCTDVAGRGLDLPRVEFVISLDVPSDPQVYVHRTGRTARAGRKGVALTFVEPSAVRAVHRVEAYIKTQLQPLPSFNEHEVLKHLNHYSRALQKAALFLNEIGFDEKAEQHEAYTKAFKELRRRKKEGLPLLL